MLPCSETFKTSSFPQEGYIERFAIDNKYVYNSWKIVEWADPKTFHFIEIVEWFSSRYSTDSTWRTYICWEPLDIDPETFKVIWLRYAYDKYWIYEVGKKINGVMFEEMKEKYNIPFGEWETLWNSIIRSFKDSLSKFKKIKKNLFSKISFAIFKRF